MNKIAKVDNRANQPAQMGVRDLAESARRLADFDRFAKEADSLIEISRKFEKVCDKLESKFLHEAESAIKDARQLFNNRKGAFTLAEQLVDQWEKLQPNGYWTEDSEGESVLSPSFVMVMVAELLAAYPTHSIPNVKAFVQTLVKEIVAREPRWFALNSTLLHLRRTSKFVPTLSELFETLDREETLWTDRLRACCLAEELIGLPAMIEKAEARVALERAKLVAEGERIERERRERERLERDRERQRALPIAPGDRVEVEYLGPGTAVRPWGDDLMLVAFDRLDYEHCMDISCLKRLLPGDVNFEQVRA